MRRKRLLTTALVAATSCAACTLLTSLDGLSDGEIAGDGGTGSDGGGGEGASASDGGADAVARVDGEAGLARYPIAVLANEPLLYYRFGEPAGSPAKDEVSGTTTAYPVQGITQGAPGGLVGDTNTAISVDGTGKLDLAQPTDFEGVLPFSVEVWLSRSPTLTSNVGFVVDHEAWSGGRQGWFLGAGPAAYGFERWVTVDGGSKSNSTGADEPIVAGEWHHVVGTFDGSALRLYVDSVRRDVYTSAPIAISKIGTTFAVGKQNCSPCSGTGFIGVIDELAIYGKALSEAQILAHYRAGKNL